MLFRSFCSQCIAGAEQRGVALMNPVTHVCAICDYQSVKRPNCTVTQWHWTFTDHDGTQSLFEFLVNPCCLASTVVVNIYLGIMLQ